VAGSERRVDCCKKTVHVLHSYDSRFVEKVKEHRKVAAKCQKIRAPR
jgi:hypothetical protein